MNEQRPAWLIPLSELEEEDAEPLRTLTEQEGVELIRRLNSTASRSVAPEEWEFLWGQPPIRYSADVARIRRLLDQEDNGSQYCAGVRAALAYAFGELPAGPVSGQKPRHHPPRCGDLDVEVEVVTDAIRGDLDNPPSLTRDYMVGVEHTVMWLTCSTDDPPVGPLR
jgi:hypothetical protein